MQGESAGYRDLEENDARRVEDVGIHKTVKAIHMAHMR